MKSNLISLLALTALLASNHSLALPEDRSKPIHISADSAQIDEKTGVTHYKGDVSIRQGTLLIEADEVELYRADGDIERLIATSTRSAAHFRQKPTAAQPWTDAWGSKLEYEIKKQSLTISGNGKVQQGKDHFSGERIVYNIERSIVNAFGGKQGKGRVQMVIQPKAKTADE